MQHLRPCFPANPVICRSAIPECLTIIHSTLLQRLEWTGQERFRRRPLSSFPGILLALLSELQRFIVTLTSSIFLTSTRSSISFADVRGEHDEAECPEGSFEAEHIETGCGCVAKWPGELPMRLCPLRATD